MNQHPMNRIGVVVATILALAAGAVWASQEEGQPREDVVLTGQLDVDEVRNFVLIERESGERVLLESSANLEVFVGATVRVVGAWAEDAAGSTYFLVREVRQSA